MADESTHLSDPVVQSIHLSSEDQRALAGAILNPPPPSPAMVRAADSHKRLVRQVLPVETLSDADLKATPNNS